MGDPVDRSDLEKLFEAAMYEIYDRAGHEIGYWATRYLQMLRRRGGLDTAHYLLSQKATSGGYRALRDAGRLDLTVEAYVLRPEFQPLFSARELDHARERLAFYDRLVEEARPAEPVDPELAKLLSAAQSAPAARRVALYRDRVAAFGARAVPWIEDWVAEGGSVGFACVTIELIGTNGSREEAIRSLGRLQAGHQDWSTVIQSSIARLRNRREWSMTATRGSA